MLKLLTKAPCTGAEVEAGRGSGRLDGPEQPASCRLTGGVAETEAGPSGAGRGGSECGLGDASEQPGARLLGLAKPAAAGRGLPEPAEPAGSRLLRLLLRGLPEYPRRRLGGRSKQPTLQ